jgi:hypothetical protein
MVQTCFGRSSLLEKIRIFTVLSFLLAVLVLSFCVSYVHAAGNSIILCRIGDATPQAWTTLRQYFEDKGYQVTFYQGEATVERHVEKVSGLNRGPGAIFLAVELVPASRPRVMVAVTDARKGEGRFLTIDQVPDRFARESEKLAAFVAAPFKVKVKRLPLFPLLGINMPGVFVRMQFKEGEVEDGAKKLYAGVDRYFAERTTK